MNHLKAARPFLVMAVVVVVCVMESHGYTPTELNRWTIFVYTGAWDWSDSNSVVAIKITGSKGETWGKVLKNDGIVDFQRKGVDVFWIYSRVIGEPYQIEIWAGENGNAWYLKKIEVEPRDNEYTYTSWVFECDCWFDSNSGWEITYRTLFPRRVIKRKYKIVTYTGSDKSADTKDSTWIQLHGSNYRRSSFQPLNIQSHVLRRGARSVYYIGVEDSIGDPHAITIKGAQAGDHWYLVKVDMETFKGQTRWVYKFTCNSWFKTSWRLQADFNFTSKTSVSDLV